MIDLYPAYKPFRNYMRKYALWPSLIQMWAYSIHIVDDEPLHPLLGIGSPDPDALKRHIWPWDLEIIVRELILNADKYGSDALSTWNGLANTLQHIRRLEGEPYKGQDNRANVLVDLQRMAHRQFRWQSGARKRAAQLIRALKVFGGPELEEKVLVQIGMTMSQMLKLGLIIAAELRRKPLVQLDANYSTIGIPAEASQNFLQRLVCDISEMRYLTKNVQQYNDAWLYASFPLEFKPLLRIGPKAKNRAACPVPTYMINRISSGVFYDIVNADDFANSYGGAFQRYIGEVINKIMVGGRFKVDTLAPYSPSKANLKHGVDWIVSDGSGHLFIECKTKRMSLGAKNLTDETALDKDMEALKKAVVQNYSNIIDAREGLTTWVDDGAPVYPLIITLEDWHLFSTHLTDRLRISVTEGLAAKKIDPQIIERMPYSIASASDFETLLQVVAVKSITEIFALKTDETHRSWGWLGFLPTTFPEETTNAKVQLFEDEVQQLLG